MSEAEHGHEGPQWSVGRAVGTLVGASLEVMDRDAAAVRGGRPVIFCSLRKDPLATKIADWVRAALTHAR